MDALSPLDGRYSEKLNALRPFFSESALQKYRVLIEISYFIALSEESGIRELPKLNGAQKKALWKIVENFSEKDSKAITSIEKKTNHDVKAVEYFLREKFAKIPGLKNRTNFIHFALTSEDVNNLSYGLMVTGALSEVIKPNLRTLIAEVSRLARVWKNVPMMSMTHGQPATPTTVGKEFQVFVDRLSAQFDQLKQFKMNGKFGGAVGNYAAHKAAYPDFKWTNFGSGFIKSLGLKPLSTTTQINPHDDIAELSHILCRINSITIDLSRDMWLYISRGIFKQKLKEGEVGSSTMPHKVNPIDFENAEGNLGISSALFSHLALTLPISRMQRDLTDSTVQRNIGVAFGHHLLAMTSLRKGLGKIIIDKNVLKDELHNEPGLRAEAIQTVLRKYGVPDAYERLKKLTRGAKISHSEIDAFIETLPIPKPEKVRLRSQK